MLVTDERIIAVGVRKSASLSFDDFEQVRVVTPILGRLLGYGHVLLMTAMFEGDCDEERLVPGYEMRNVRRPLVLAKTIVDSADRAGFSLALLKGSH